MTRPDAKPPTREPPTREPPTRSGAAGRRPRRPAAPPGWITHLKLLSLALSLSACRPTQAAPSGPPLDLSGFQMTFEERFQSLDVASQPGTGARWYTHTPWKGDFGDARFGEPGPDGPFVLRPGGLSIVARRAPDQRWRSGLIASRDRDGEAGRGFAQAYGYFEMKARLPEGMGVWPAFWLIGTDKSKGAAEVDVMEFYGGFPEYYHATGHVWRGKAVALDRQFLIRVPAHQLSAGYNTFGVDIEPDTTTFYLDLRPVAAMPTPPDYRTPFYLLADLALGGGWPTASLQSPQSMDIAWIRVYRRTATTRTAAR